MSILPNQDHGKVTVPELMQRKNLAADSRNAKKITCLTAYDYPTARLLDEAGVDILLVGDSLGMVVLGYESTLPVTLEEMLQCTRAVRRGTRRALLVADMPYGSYHDDPADAVRHAVRFVKEAGAEAVKIEGGERRMELIARMVDAEIPVMGHIGLTPQSVNRLGGYRARGRDDAEAARIHDDAAAISEAGAFAIVIEGTIDPVARRITQTISAPTIGIGRPALASRPAATAQTLACEPTEMSICRARITSVIPRAATRIEAFRTAKSASGRAWKNLGARTAIEARTSRYARATENSRR